MSLEDEVKKLRNDVQSLRDEVRNRRPDPVLLPGGLRVMFVTAEIGAMAGDTTGAGQAVDAVYDAASKQLTPGAGPGVDVRNYHDRRFLDGGLIAADLWRGELWAFDIGKCTDFVA